MKKEVAVDDRKTSGTETIAFRRFAAVDFSGVLLCPSLFVSDLPNGLLVAPKTWCSDESTKTDTLVRHAHGHSMFLQNVLPRIATSVKFHRKINLKFRY